MVKSFYVQGATLVLKDLVFQVFIIEFLIELKLNIANSIHTSVFHITRPLRSLLIMASEPPLF